MAYVDDVKSQMTGAGATHDFALGWTVTPGNGVIVIINGWEGSGGYDSNPPQLYDDDPATGNLIGTASLAVKAALGGTGSGDGVRSVIYYLLSAGANIDWIRINNNTPGVVYGQVEVMEWSGLASSALDEVASDAFTRSGSAQFADTGNTAALSQADQLVVAGMTVYDFQSNIGIGANAVDAANGDAAYTNLYVEQNAESNIGGSADYRVVASTNAVNASWTHNDVSDQKGYSCAVATFMLDTPSGHPTRKRMAGIAHAANRVRRTGGRLWREAVNGLLVPQTKIFLPAR